MKTITDKSAGVLPLPNASYVGLILVLSAKGLSPAYRRSAYQLHRACGGFGCEPGKAGSAIFAACLADGEEARWSRSDFIGYVTPETAAEVLKPITAQLCRR